MKIAYCIDRESLGGGCEYIRRKRDEARGTGDETAVFYSDKGECRAATLDAWGAEEIVINHLKALLQLLGPFRARPRGKVRAGLRSRRAVYRRYARRMVAEHPDLARQATLELSGSDRALLGDIMRYPLGEKIAGAFRCLRERGLIFTLRRLMGRKMA